MLIYHPAFDVNHAMLRFGRILNKIQSAPVQWDKLRILDFYYLFPHLVSNVQLPSGRRLKAHFARQANKYNDVPSPRLFLRQIEGLQELAIKSLASKGFVDPQSLKQGLVVRTDEQFPAELLSLTTDDAAESKLLLDLLTTVATVPLVGPKGLKARTGLLEHRYDPD